MKSQGKEEEGFKPKEQVKKVTETREEAELKRQSEMFNPKTMVVKRKVLHGSLNDEGLWDDSHVYPQLIQKVKDI